jgi:GT2 family glycosyltransferase
MTESPSPTIIIIILNWNGLSDTLECLESITKLCYPHRHAVVVDNGSGDGSQAEIKNSFAYHEDLDYSLRAIKAGYRTTVNTTAVVYHKWAASSGADSPMRRHFFTRNWYLFWKTHLKGFQKHTYAPKYLAWALAEAISLRDEGAQASADACLDGAWSALRLKYGPLHETVQMPRALKGLFYAHPYFCLGVLRGNFPHVLRALVAQLLGRA